MRGVKRIRFHFIIPPDILLTVIRITLNFPRIWQGDHLERLQAMIHHYAGRFYALLQTSKRILQSFLVAGATKVLFLYCRPAHFPQSYINFRSL